MSNDSITKRNSSSATIEAFKKDVDELLAKCSYLQKITVHTNTEPLIDAKFSKERTPPHANVNTCSSLLFMQTVVGRPKELEHRNDMVHYEHFGLKMSTVQIQEQSPVK
ncbi:AIS_HP2_G0021010.mRNA.1.CDS.1 [Saccharomyces cerevisiae]|nr:AIS_HP2_G0021010.mRNA.1.CDS.1 [Saccharomyces cerevisiae]CAI6533015.1 AIS_HP2_G0021010.mRNA.1.CDS.1 [Saccharomyces cerevisiae]